MAVQGCTDQCQRIGPDGEWVGVQILVMVIGHWSCLLVDWMPVQGGMLQFQGIGPDDAWIRV